MGYCPRAMKVLVTGANGHVGFTLASLLVERGHQVRASMRNAADPEKSAPLRKLGVEVVEADILDPAAMERAAAGVEGLFHVAAVFQMVVTDPQNTLIRPAVEGVENALRAAKRAGLRRVVLTSSTVAVGTRRPADRPIDERDWNDGAHAPYAVAKVRAERRAVELAKELDVDLVAVNPTAILGPGFHRHTPSTAPIRAMLEGDMPVAPPVRAGYVDVRDVALGHLQAMENERASGRYILNARALTMLELAGLVGQVEPGAKVPRRMLPPWAVPMIVFFDWIMAAARGTPRLASNTLLEENGDLTLEFDSSRAQRELGWKPRPVEESVADTVRWIQEHNPPLWS